MSNKKGNALEALPFLCNIQAIDQVRVLKQKTRPCDRVI